MTRLPRQPLLLLMAVTVCGAAGCRPAEDPPLAVWVANDMVTLTDRTKPVEDPVIRDPDTRAVLLSAAANETISFQLVIDPGQVPANGIRLRFSDLAGPGEHQIDATRFAPLRAMPVRVTHYPAWYLRLVPQVPEPATFFDALVPMSPDKDRLKAGAGERLVVWVDLAVPGQAAAGQYVGSLTVSAARRKTHVLTLKLKVHGFVLPDTRPIAAVGGFDHKVLFGRFIQRQGAPFEPVRMDLRHPLVRRGLIIMRQLMRLSHAHRLDLFETSIRPILKRDLSGKVKLDWTEYDAVVLPYVNGTAFTDRIPTPAWPVPFSDTWPDPDYYGGLDGKQYFATAEGLLDGCSRHLAKVVEDPARMFVWPRRGPVDAAAYGRFVKLARIVRAADGDLAILSSLPLHPPAQTGWSAPEGLAQLIDIRAPSGEFLFAGRAPAGTGRRRLAGLWFSPGRPPYTPSLGVMATGADARAIPWFAMRYGCTGLLIPEVLHWTGDPFKTPAGAEARLFYPGNAVGRGDEVLPSVRLKRLRRGLQDITYLWLLRQRKKEDVAGSIARAMARYAGQDAVGDHYLDPRLDGWVQEPKTWAMARRLMAGEIEAAIGKVPADDHTLRTRRLDWSEFEEKVHTVRVEQVRSRVTEVGDGRLRATVLLDLYNEFRRSVDVVVGLGKLPAGWEAADGTAQLTGFLPATRKVVTLTMTGLHVPAGTSGKMRLPVSLGIDRRWRKELTASVPFVLAGRSGKPVVIDGQLDDWPIRPNSAAGQFRLIGRRGRGAGLAARQTLVQVLRDPTHLYLSFRCDEPRMQDLVVRPDNIVRYDQLMACGEDLVEVILDPGMAGQTAADLYHIVVKPNGVVVTERGVNCRPALGKVSPWPAQCKVATRRPPKQWIVELAVPLSAFGRAGGARLWGVNFARFATIGAEASSWSGAPRYFYDPRNLGTMYVGPATDPRED